MCDIHPVLPNQCGSAELKEKGGAERGVGGGVEKGKQNLPGGIILLPSTTGAKGLPVLFPACPRLPLLVCTK